MKTQLGRSRHALVRQLVAALALAAWSSGTLLLAGQTGSAVEISVTLLPAGAGSGCTASVDARGLPTVNCRPPVISAGSGGTASAGGSGQPVIGHRSPNARMLVADAVTEEAESYFAWGEYSSRTIFAGGREYLEMTVTW